MRGRDAAPGRQAISSSAPDGTLFSSGSFVFGSGNIDLYTHISETFGDNASPEALLAAIPAARTNTKT
jgi:hypothetical protein